MPSQRLSSVWICQMPFTTGLWSRPTYLADRRRYTSFEGRTSTLVTIKASVVQGSVIGPHKVHRHHSWPTTRSPQRTDSWNMPMTLISLSAHVISRWCTMSPATSLPGWPESIYIWTLPRHVKWWSYERPDPLCRLHHRSWEEPAAAWWTSSVDEQLSPLTSNFLHWRATFCIWPRTPHSQLFLFIICLANTQSPRDASEYPSPGNIHDNDWSADVWLFGLVGVFERKGP